MIDRLLAWLRRPTDPSALAAFRVAFGLLVAVSAARFLAYGWIDTLLARPAHQLKYWGFSWVPALPAPFIHGVFAALVVLGLLVAAGLFYRAAIVLLFVLFTYVQLVDVANYLNHYYLVSLLAALLAFMPAHRAFSLDAWRRPGLRAAAVPLWPYALLRFQIATVYTFAGLAKLTSDWLLHAQPLQIWLAARTHLPLLGPYLDRPWVAYAAAWFGFLFDTSIAWLLLWRRTRRLAYLAVLAFHAATWALFPIGMFPFIMTTAALVFFAPDWPRRAIARVLGPRAGVEASPAAQPAPASAPPRSAWPARAALGAAAIYVALQIFLPLRSRLYDGNVLWHEQGMRFSWRVMAREKNGSVTFVVEEPRGGRRHEIPPRRYLSALQERELSVQPDLIQQLARTIARDFAARGVPGVRVTADAWVSLNGRPAARFIDPTADLASAPDGLGARPWILPAPDGPPIRLRPLVAAR